MIQALHTYGDWIKTPDNHVGVIIADCSGYRSMVRWHGGKVATVPIFDYVLITEYEYFEVAEPERCGLSINEIVERCNQGRQEDYFTGGYLLTTIVSQIKESFF